MLIDIVIANPTRVDLVSQATFFYGVVATIVVQMNDNFLSQSLVLLDIFLPLTIKVFECLHNKQMGFFIDMPTGHEK